MDPSAVSCPEPIERPPPVLSPPEVAPEAVPRPTQSNAARTEPVTFSSLPPSPKPNITQSRGSGISSQVGTVARPRGAAFISDAQRTVSAPPASSSTLQNALVLSPSATSLERFINAEPYTPMSHPVSASTSINTGTSGTRTSASTALLERLINPAPYTPRSHPVSASTSINTGTSGTSMSASTASLERLINAAPYTPRSHLKTETGSNDTVSASTSTCTRMPASSGSSLGRLANEAPYIPRSYHNADMDTNDTTSAATSTTGTSMPASSVSPLSTVLSGTPEEPIFKFIPVKLDESQKLASGLASNIDREFERWRTSRPSSEPPLTSISGSASDGFPHQDIINELLDEDTSHGKNVYETHKDHSSKRY